MNIIDRAELTATLARHGLDKKLRVIDGSWDDQNLTRCHIVDNFGQAVYTILPWYNGGPSAHEFAAYDNHHNAWLVRGTPADALEKALTSTKGV